jgi:hypothetical protein
VSRPSVSVVVPVPAAAGLATAGIAKVTITMPLAVMVRGFVKAVRSYEAAVAAEHAWDVHIAMFETFAWLDSLDKRCGLAGTVEIRAMRFARQRTHHLYAAPIYPDQAIGGWRWYKLELLPLADPNFPDPKGERIYRAVLEDRPVVDALRRAEAVVRKLAPDADLS